MGGLFPEGTLAYQALLWPATIWTMLANGGKLGNL